MTSKTGGLNLSPQPTKIMTPSPDANDRVLTEEDMGSMQENVLSDGLTDGGARKTGGGGGARMSILKDMSGNLSRKEKIEVFEMKMNEFDDIIPDIEEDLSKLDDEV
jgi:hypothetical protein